MLSPYTVAVHNMSVTFALLVFFLMKEILALIPDEDTPIIGEFEPSDWVVKNFGSYLAIKRNNNNTDVIGDNRRYDSPYEDPYYHYYHHYHHHPHPPPHIFQFPSYPMMTTTPAPNAQILTSPKALSLICEVTPPFEHISWTLYRCPQKNYMPEKVQITSGSTLFQTKYYDVNIAGSSGKYTSTLSIKDINPEETGGLYRCDGYPVGTESGVPPSLTTTDYFIVGKKNSLQDCFVGPTPRFILQNGTNRAFHDGAAPLHQTLGNIIATAAKDEYREPRLIPNKTFQYILKIPFNKTATQDYKIRFSMKFDGNGSNGEGDITPQIDKLNKITFNTTGEIEEDINPRVDNNVDAIPFNVTDAVTFPSPSKHQYWDWLLKVESENDLQGLKPPESQKSREIPVQNNSYVRFDYTNGEKIQNWGSYDRTKGIKAFRHAKIVEPKENAHKK